MPESPLRAWYTEAKKADGKARRTLEPRTERLAFFDHNRVDSLSRATRIAWQPRIQLRYGGLKVLHSAPSPWLTCS